MKRSTETLLMCIFFFIVAIYLVDCTIDTIANLELLGAAMFAFKPSFTVSNLVNPQRRWKEGSRQRNYAGLHTPIYRVLNACQQMMLDKSISRDFDVYMNRGQSKHIYRDGVLEVVLCRGYSAVSIGARMIFAVDEWDKTIYHIDSSGRLAVTPFTQDYDMTDVIAQAIEAVEVVAEHYDAEKYKAIDAAKARQEWYCYGADNLGVVNDTWQRATVSLWHIRDANKSVEWTKYWGRMTPNGSKQYKTTTGEHPTAYRVAIGDKSYWVPHSICSRTTELHGGRQSRHDGSSRFLGFSLTSSTLDLPVWWLEKTIGVDWSDKVEPLGRSEFFKSFVKPRRQWRRR